MTQFFNKRFWLYWVLTLLAVLIFYILLTANQYLDTFIYHSIPFNYATKFTLISVGIALSSAIAVAAATSSFITFRRTSSKGISSFFQLLGIGLIFFLPFSIGAYLYDNNITPKLKMRSMKILYSIKTYSSYPNEIRDSSDLSHYFGKISNFENSTPIVLSGKTLQLRLDSLEKEQSKLISECSKLLSQLPSDLAEEAYSNYKLDLSGISYQFSETPTINSDSLLYIQRVLLYDYAKRLAETTDSVNKFQIEKYKRISNATSILLFYIIFATMGYILRGKTLTKIFGIIAIIIVATYGLQLISSSLSTYLKEILTYTK